MPATVRSWVDVQLPAVRPTDGVCRLTTRFRCSIADVPPLPVSRTRHLPFQRDDGSPPGLKRNQPTEVQVRRGETHLRLTFTITRPNWTTWGRGVVAFQVARAFVLFLALLLAFKRPDDLAVRLAALVFAMIAVAEAFPSAGWAAALRHLPPIVAVPIALATVSWLLITVPWFSLVRRVPANAVEATVGAYRRAGGESAGLAAVSTVSATHAKFFSSSVLPEPFQRAT